MTYTYDDFLQKAFGAKLMTNDAVNSDISPEQFQLAMQLESIFMPQARKQREDAYERLKRSGDTTAEPQLRFVHYTSAEAALNIIKTKRIWMRNTTCMSDYREVQHGFDILNKFFSDESKSGPFVAALEACAPSAAREAIDLFNQWWKNIRFSTYVTSISEHDKEEDLHGRLSMWRAFGGGTARVALIFKVPRISKGSLALNLLFSPVAYLTEDEAHAVIHEITTNISNNLDLLRSISRPLLVQTVFYMFVAGVTCLKHEGFRE
jgi:hypothetical protein